MIHAKILSGKAYCGTLNCRADAFGMVGVDGRLYVSSRWRWDEQADPPRWRHTDRNRGREEVSGSPGSIGTLRRKSDGSMQRVWVISIPLAGRLVIQCPRCRALQAIEGLVS